MWKKVPPVPPNERDVCSAEIAASFHAFCISANSTFKIAMRSISEEGDPIRDTSLRHAIYMDLQCLMAMLKVHLTTLPAVTSRFVFDIVKELIPELYSDADYADFFSRCMELDPVEPGFKLPHSVNFLCLNKEGRDVPPSCVCAELFISLLVAVAKYDRELQDDDPLIGIWRVGLQEFVLTHRRRDYQEATSSNVQNDSKRVDPYAVLGIKSGSTKSEIQTAHRQKVREWHPDQLESMAPELKAFATARLADINAAYQEVMENLANDDSSKESRLNPLVAESYQLGVPFDANTELVTKRESGVKSPMILLVIALAVVGAIALMERSDQTSEDSANSAQQAVATSSKVVVIDGQAVEETPDHKFWPVAEPTTYELFSMTQVLARLP
jgi:hypothetical protein